MRQLLVAAYCFVLLTFQFNALYAVASEEPGQIADEVLYAKWLKGPLPRLEGRERCRHYQPQRQPFFLAICTCIRVIPWMQARREHVPRPHKPMFLQRAASWSCSPGTKQGKGLRFAATASAARFCHGVGSRGAHRRSAYLQTRPM